MLHFLQDIGDSFQDVLLVWQKPMVLVQRIADAGSPYVCDVGFDRWWLIETNAFWVSMSPKSHRVA